MLAGTITRAIAGFYYVKTEQGLFECKARGLFRKDNITPLVGDKVEIQIVDADKKVGYMEQVKDRKNELNRPKVANVDLGLIVFAASEPKINYDLLDRLTTVLEEQEIEVVLCLNKTDLKENAKESFEEIYAFTNYRIIYTNINEDKQEIKDLIENKITFLTGPSGVGKSTIINGLNAGLDLETAEISKKISRGKHTTREVSLFEVFENSFIIDTPGFSSLQLDHIEKENLALYFPEILPLISSCKFSACSHRKELGCAVIEAVGSKIHEQRYKNYIRFYNQLEDLNRY